MTTVYLSNELEEISGLEWVSEDELWAIEDESSVIYVLNPITGEITFSQKFAKNADIEDILTYSGVAYALQSNGDIYQINNPLKETSESTTFKFPLKGKNDFEAIIKSNQESALWIFCKDCQSDKSDKISSVYSFDLEKRNFEPYAKKILKTSDLKQILNEKELKNLRMQPSGIAYHPIEHNYYLLSSSDQWLMILDQQLVPKEFYKLDPAIFKQPEGITFSPNGDLFISNEARGSKPNLLRFPYKPS
ncbi:SdiA-regulated domain-containing protein [Algoriphagus sp.]|uniref:SdiA-regulated domain-containing protein n=1 Tax=Algoriphagus sp. TaxID=1872435 RepID=UPI0025DF0465|nr:SdiA-regulated domain-containing protein [Algoriphagus sp.]